MKVVILAGGFGTRLSELTSVIPKPMVEIGGKPILWHIMNSYANYGYNEFIIALGYKGEVIKKYFLDYFFNNSDFKVNLSDGSFTNLSKNSLNWKITCIDTGLNTMTGGRIKRLEKYLDSPFMLTYGDGLSDINIKNLKDQHERSDSILTMTTIHPSSRYGKVVFDNNNIVTKFQEKPKFGGDWINGGYMVVEPEIFKFLHSDDEVLEERPLKHLSDIGKVSVFKHEGFWHCMDNLRDKNTLEDIWNSGEAPWK